MRSTSSIRPPRRHWWTALCSLSMGRRGLPWRRASAVINSPAATRHSLLASPTVLPDLHRLVGGFESGHADDRADHEIHIGMSGHPHRSGWAMHDFNILHSCSLQPGVQNFRIDCGRNGNNPGLPAPDLLEGSFHIAPRGQGNHLEALGISFDHAERTAPDRARGSQDGNAFHMEAGDG